MPLITEDRTPRVPALGATITGLATPYGSLDVAVAGSADQLRVRIAGAAMPPGGFVLPVWAPDRHTTAAVDGEPAPVANGAVTIVADGKPHVVVMETHR